MRFIKKTGTPYEAKGKKATKEFIDSCWCETTMQYNNLIYDRSRLCHIEEILVNEQKDHNGDSYCCYCMRKLYLRKTDVHRSNVTLEHIIPHKIKESEWNANRGEYEKFANLRETYIRVFYNGDLTSTQKVVKIKRMPYPHFISYYNLVASCDGTILEEEKLQGSRCCNNNRQERFVLPIYLKEDLSTGLGYDKKGLLDYDDLKYEEKWFDRNHLNLNNSWIVLVRKLWYKISKSEYSDLNIEQAIKDKNMRQEIIDDIDSCNEIMSWINNDNAWNLLSEYSWFYQYYKNKYKC